MCPTAQPIIIPGKKRPAGTFTPYVMANKMYQHKKKTNISKGVMMILLLIMFWMISP